MNRQHAEAWDEVAEQAAARGGRLRRIGSTFHYHWKVSDISVALWATEDQPRYNLRVGETSARCWSLAAALTIVNALLDKEYRAS